MVAAPVKTGATGPTVVPAMSLVVKKPPVSAAGGVTAGVVKLDKV